MFIKLFAFILLFKFIPYISGTNARTVRISKSLTSSVTPTLQSVQSHQLTLPSVQSPPTGPFHLPLLSRQIPSLHSLTANIPTLPLSLPLSPLHIQTPLPVLGLGPLSLGIGPNQVGVDSNGVVGGAATAGVESFGGLSASAGLSLGNNGLSAIAVAQALANSPIVGTGTTQMGFPNSGTTISSPMRFPTVESQTGFQSNLVPILTIHTTFPSHFVSLMKQGQFLHPSIISVGGHPYLAVGYTAVQHSRQHSNDYIKSDPVLNTQYRNTENYRQKRVIF